ncbi:hypothetical protein BKA64DRAFT_354673 [Cadophora sp. MPI-SDFR-AT-0126]|nr:hypothetical protein BKA64DRAFT_354673 [Leotiomycetes sp. MPI-SDFR-AT-0126]
MPDKAEQLRPHPSAPLRSNRHDVKHLRANSKSESTDSLVVSSIPIFVMEDNDVLTDGDEVSGSEGSMSASTRMGIEEWMDVRDEGDGREDTSRASEHKSMEADEGDETVLLQSPSREIDSKTDNDETPRAAGKWKCIKDGDAVLADPLVGHHYSKEGYKPLPGLFGEAIHYGEKKRLINRGNWNRSVVFPDSVHKDTDMTGVSITYSKSDAQGDAFEDDDTPKYHNIDDIWMGNLLRLPWVTKDMRIIFDAKSKKLVPMPRRRLERKKLVIDLYCFLIKGVWLVQLDAVGNWREQTIPTALWWDVFTEKESEDLQEATYRKLHFDIVTRAITVVEEWRLRYGFPKVPETVQETVDAKQEKAARHEMKCEILTKASGKSVDRWIKYVFQGVMDVENMEKVLRCELDGIRQRVISKLIHVTELPFSGCWTVCDLLFWPFPHRCRLLWKRRCSLNISLTFSRLRHVSRYHYATNGKWRISLKSSWTVSSTISTSTMSRAQ